MTNLVDLIVAASQVDDGRPLLESALELAGQVRQLEDVLTRMTDATKFAAVVESLEYERSSTRALVTVRAGDDADAEQLRTDRTDTAYGLLVARRAKRMIGRRCLVHKLVEDAGTKRVRVLVWLEDLEGEAPA